MVQKSYNLRNLSLLTLLYFIAHGLILLNNGVFWDDWLVFNMDHNVLIDTGNQMGQVQFSYLHIFLLSLGKGILSYRIAVFFSFLFAGFFLYAILSSIKPITETARTLIVAFFMVFPVNSARISMSTVQYSICYFLFYFGFWLVVKFKSTGRLSQRLLAIILLFCSFFTNSFLVFFLVILLFLFYYDLQNSKIKSFATLTKHLVNHIDFYILPIVFWLVKSSFFVPSKLYAGYNSVGLEGILDARPLVTLAFKHSFWEILKKSFGIDNWELIFISLLCLAILYLFGFLKDHGLKETGLMASTLGFLLGVVFIFLAVFPYIVVGKLPSDGDWSSRHQLLVPLGAAFILYFALNMIFQKYRSLKIIGLFIQMLLIVSFITIDINKYLDFQRDWYKQVALIENIKADELFYKHNTFLFKDNTIGLNANGRIYRFYEYTGIMKLVFGDEKRFGETKESFKGKNEYKEFINSHYNLKDYPSNLVIPEFEVVINKGNFSLDSNYSVIRMVYEEWLLKEQFNANIKQLVKLTDNKLGK